MTEFVITGDAQRTVKYDYPLDAIREIIINMIVHRDYTDGGTISFLKSLISNHSSTLTTFIFSRLFSRSKKSL